MDGAIMWAGGRSYSLRKNLEFGNEELKRINDLRQIRPERSTDKKLNFVEMFFRLTLEQGPTFLRGAFYVTILEAIYVASEKDELSYKFALRLTKKKGFDTIKFKKLRDLYRQRSVVFHGGVGKFSEEDILFLETETVFAIENYTLNHLDFKGDSLDRLLLS